MERFLIKKPILLLAFLVSVFIGCNEIEQYDEKPIITESSFELLKNESGFDTALLLKFTFTDGDGNVGLSDGDDTPPFDNNVLVDYLEKVNGKFTKILIPGSTDTLNFNSRIKSFGNGTSTKAEVSININIAVVIADTVRFDYFIVDKDLNKSNTVTTGEIVLNN
jgi:hypothetical protein